MSPTGSLDLPGSNDHTDTGIHTASGGQHTSQCYSPQQDTTTGTSRNDKELLGRAATNASQDTKAALARTESRTDPEAIDDTKAKKSDSPSLGYKIALGITAGLLIAAGTATIAVVFIVTLPAVAMLAIIVLSAFAIGVGGYQIKSIAQPK